MLDFTAVKEEKISFADLVAPLTPADLAALTVEMVDIMQALIAEAVDADVVFVPQDPAADDPFASSPADEKIAWTLGHVVVHATASAEEAAFLAAELARGVENHGRSRYEASWQTVTTIAQCRERLEESRRMRLASLDLWPTQPHLDVRFTTRYAGDVNAVGRFVLGLRHDWSHLGQIADIMRQAQAARS